MPLKEYQQAAFDEHLHIDMKDGNSYPLSRFTLSFSPPTDKSAEEITDVIQELDCFDITERLSKNTIGSYNVCCPEEQALQHIDNLQKRLARIVGLKCQINYEVMYGNHSLPENQPPEKEFFNF